ncbi:MAG: type II toxin-antitoxin system PemK/MazF family toxin [Actinomycetes bacterium]
MVRGECLELRSLRGSKGREQQGRRYAVVVQSDHIRGLGTVMVAPTSASVVPTSFRPAIEMGGQLTRVLVEQTIALDERRLGRSVGRLSAAEMTEVERALSTVLGLQPRHLRG